MAPPKKNTATSGSTSPSKPPTSTIKSTSAGSARSATRSTSNGESGSPAKSKSAPAKAREAVAKAGSKVPKAAKGKGKVLAASAGVAAAAVAAGVAYYRGTRGSDASSDGRSVYHVLPATEGWQLKGAGADRAVSNHATKKEALTAGRELAHSKVPSQLVVHKSDGTIQESWTYDSD